MVFKSFRAKLVMRVVILGLAFAALAIYLQKENYYFTTIVIITVAVLLTIELVIFVERGYRHLNTMLQSVKHKDFSIQFKPVDSGTVFTNLANLLNDLTLSYQQVRIEKEVHYQFLNHLVNQVQQVIICIQPDGTVSLANRAASTLFSAREVKHVNQVKRFSHELYDRLLAIPDGSEEVFSFVHRGDLLRYSISCTSIKLLSVPQRLVVMHDIRRPMQAQEQESYRKLTRVLTHEIMNSVTPILSLSQAMNDTLRNHQGVMRTVNELSEQEANDIVDGYQAIEVRSRALMRFVNDFKSLSRLPEPKFAIHSMADTVKAVCTLMKPTLDERSIAFRIHIGTCMKLPMDRDMVEQVLINVLKNAVEALSQSPEPMVEVNVEEDKMQLMVLIIDNGEGVTRDNLDTVFTPFFTTKPKGSGIGLSLSKQIMHLHGGDISLKSEQGRGATFTLRFPIKNQ